MDRRVLVVEEDESVLTRAETIFARPGWSATGARTVQRAQSRLARRIYDLIVIAAETEAAEDLIAYAQRRYIPVLLIGFALEAELPVLRVPFQPDDLIRAAEAALTGVRRLASRTSE
jgi:DNA-binding NtrC family response regulator